jgi:hypothetical protein
MPEETSVPEAVLRQEREAEAAADAALSAGRMSPQSPVEDAESGAVIVDDAAPPAPAPQTPEPQPDAIVQKFRTLQAKYDADVARLQQNVQLLTTMVQGLRQQSVAQPLPTPVPEGPDWTEGDAEKFGEDWLKKVQDVCIKVATRVATAVTTKVQAAATAKIEGERHKDRTALFAEQLRVMVPNIDDYREGNASPEFLKWCVQPIFEGMDETWQDRITEAHRAMNARALAAIVKRYEQDMGIRRDDREQQVRPRTVRAGGGAQPAGRPKRVWTADTAAKFYQDAAHGGKYTTEEIAKIEDEIFEQVKAGTG